MIEISSNTSRVAQDLNHLLNKLSDSPGSQTADLIEQTLTLDVMGNFKLAVDAMRHLLWIYVEAASRATSGDLNHSVHGQRLQRATEILRGLREDGIPIRRQLAEGSSFVEQVEALLTYYSGVEATAA